MPQDRLFRLAVEAIAVSAVYVPGEGWRVSLTARRQAEGWSEAYRVQYDRLSTPELDQVLSEELAHQLGIA